ncbi:signal transduction histidine kinase [Desulfobaculum xiamenense]|uniref:histidine kinase n=1 Tax=Desulfobaculum xiamenense TaxID=995050 RepID=A0A846QUL9_9BACT|nr:signal transduction histidine kinase [Desulfobaculum xiamenense]
MSVWKRISLRGHIFILLFSMVVVTLCVGLVAMWYAVRVDGIMTSVVGRSYAATRAAEELTIALVTQKGLTTYYFQDRNPGWLDSLEQKHGNFQHWLQKARESASGSEAEELLTRIESGYRRYVNARDQVLVLYRDGRAEEGALLHKDIRGQFHELLELCQRYRHIHEEAIAASNAEIAERLESIRNASVAAMPLVAGLGLFLAWFIVQHVLRPIRRMADEMDFARSGPLLPDELSNLGTRVRSLLEDVDLTHHKLKRSREHLKQSEKWALTGKLAAGVAHSIRNPLTSVKIRLFSLERNLSLSGEQKEDFEVITEEIGHIDSIARNFLEFSRPPKLRMQPVDVSQVVDSAMKLMRHRLESHEVEVVHDRPSPLRNISADPEQLKEVLVNLMVNACDAMGRGGRICIREEEGFVVPLGDVVMLRVSDTGPGIPETRRKMVFQPFYSSKEEGTGLGLSIAKRIVEDHGGWINVTSRDGEGATFTITLPCKEEGKWHRS